MITILITVTVSTILCYKLMGGKSDYSTIGLLSVMIGLVVGGLLALVIGSALPTYKLLVGTEIIQCSEKDNTKTCLYVKTNTLPYNTLQYYIVKKDFGAGIVSQETPGINTAIVEQNRLDAILEISTEALEDKWTAWFGISGQRPSYTFLIPKGSIKQVSEIKTTGETP